MARTSLFDTQEGRDRYIEAVLQFGDLREAASRCGVHYRTVTRNLRKYPGWEDQVKAAEREYDARRAGLVATEAARLRQPSGALDTSAKIEGAIRRKPCGTRYDDLLGLKQEGYWALTRPEYLMFLQRLAMDPAAPEHRRDWALERLDTFIMGPVMVREIAKAKRAGENDPLPVEPGVVDTSAEEKPKDRKPTVWLELPRNGTEGERDPAGVIDIATVDKGAG